jgi:hypothetical protein
LRATWAAQPEATQPKDVIARATLTPPQKSPSGLIRFENRKIARGHL